MAEASVHEMLAVEEEEELASVSSFYSEEDDDGGGDSVNSSSTSSSLCPLSSSSDDHDQLVEGPLFELSSLISLLPIKRGLWEHFDGKSQSFTSLANVRSLEDLAKPERLLIKRKLNSCKICGGGLDRHKALSPKAGDIAKKAEFFEPQASDHSSAEIKHHLLLAAAEFEY